MTTPDASALHAEQKPLAFTQASPAVATITLDPTRLFHTIDGIGFALTGGSAQVLERMSPAGRHALLEELFSPGLPEWTRMQASITHVMVLTADPHLVSERHFERHLFLDSLEAAASRPGGRRQDLRIS